MSLDVKEAERLIQLLNSSANSNTVLSAQDTSSLIAFFNSKATNEAELSRLKQTLLSTLKYSLSIADISLALQRAGGSSDGTTLAKKLILELLNHDSLEDGSSFIHSALDVIISNFELSESKLSPNTNSLAVELLLVPFMSRLDSDFILEFLERICGTAAQDEASQSEEQGKLLNPHVAPALLQEIHDLQNMTNILTTRHLASLSTRVLASLNLLVQEKEYESIPPLLYQLCALTKLASSKKKGPFAKETEVSYQILYGVAEFLSKLEKNEESHEVICTCLSHIGRTLRSNPSLPKILLNILKGKKPELIQGEKQSLRFTRMTPMLLAMGLTMASSIPRMKIVALEAIRDLVLEEEMVRSKRYSSKFVNAAMAFLMNKENVQLRMNEDGNFDDNDQFVKEAQESVFNDLKYYADCKECTDKVLIANSLILNKLKVLVSLVQRRTAGSSHSSNEVEFSSLLPTLVSLGFMLIDAVKKDIVPKENKNFSAYLLPPIPSCQTEFEGNSMSTIQQKANQNTAKLGRALLVYLFLHGSGKKEDEDEDIVTSAYINDNVEPHCRHILQSSFEKFCGMNPNSFEHALLLRDLISNEDGSETKFDKIENISQGAHMMEESFIPMIIDLLANIPSGGMPARVSSVVVPVLNILLKINLMKAKRSRRKRNTLSDHIDHCFLLAKKALFCTDVARRKVAVNLLVMILSIAIEIPKDCNAVIEEVRGYLRRCMTQHQCEVRREAYLSLIALCTDSESNVDMSQSQSQSQELLLEGDNESISDIEVNVIQILAQQLDRYMVVEEDSSALEARRRRALTRGTHLSQQVAGTSLEEGINPLSCPLRIDLCIAAGGARTQTGRQLGETVSKKKAKKPDLLEEAIERVTEPISFLLDSAISILEAKSSVSQEFPLLNALRSKLDKLSKRMANSDLEDCLKRCEDNFSKKSSPHEHHVKTLSSCLLIISTCEALMSFSNLSDDDDVENVARLFRLRQQALTHSASLILSAKVLSTKKKPVKKKKRKDSDTDEEEKKKSEIAAEDSESPVLVSTNSVNEKVLEKIKMSVETVVPQICPAVHFSFLQEMFNKCGILGQTRASDDVLHDTQDDDEENDSTFKAMLTRNEAFRRFLLEKSRQTISGETLIFKPGFRFDTVDDLTSKTDFQFVCPLFQLAPALFAEFISHVQDRQFSSLTSQTDSPLSVLALDGLKASAYRLLLVQNQMSPIIKIRTMISTILLKASSQFPSFGKAWEACSSLPSPIKECFPKEEIDIIQKLFPFVMPVANTDKDDGPRCGLLAELVQNGLETEACSLCEILKCIISALSPISRKILGFMMVHSFKKSSDSDVVGVIGIQGNDDEECGECAFHVFESMIFFDGMMNGLARIPKLSQFSSNSIRMNAGLMDLKPAIINQILERNLDSTEFQPFDGDSKMGALQLLSLSLQATNEVSTNFQEKVKDFNVSTYKLACIDAISTTLASSDLVSKNLSSSSSIIIASLENGIADVEFLNKLMSTLIDEQSAFVQRFITKMLFALGKILSVTSLYAVSMDDSGNFMSNLMKISKRIYANYTKLLGFLADNPHCINHVENKVFLKLLREKLCDRISALLLTLSEKTKMGKKSLAEGKISAYGRIAEQLVFEIERCDNALLKLSSKLKCSGFEEESTLLLDTMGSGSSDVVRGFKLQENVLKQLREEEEYSKHTSKKRKKSKTKKSKSTKRQKIPNESDEGNDSDEGEHFMSDDNSSTTDQSMQGNENEDSGNDDSDSDNSGSDDDESQINFDLSMDDGDDDETEDEMD